MESRRVFGGAAPSSTSAWADNDSCLAWSRSCCMYPRPKSSTAASGIEQGWELLYEPRGTGATRGGVFGEPQLVDAVSVQAGAQALAMQAARFDLGKVQQQRGEELIRLAYQAPRASEQLLVIDVRETGHASRNELGQSGRHELWMLQPWPTVHPRFRSSSAASCGVFEGIDAFELIRGDIRAPARQDARARRIPLNSILAG